MQAPGFLPIMAFNTDKTKNRLISTKSNTFKNPVSVKFLTSMLILHFVWMNMLNTMTNKIN